MEFIFDGVYGFSAPTAHARVRTHASSHAHTHTHTRARARAHTHTPYTHRCIPIYTHKQMHIYTHIYTHIYIHTCTHTRIHTCTYIHTDARTDTQIHKQWRMAHTPTLTPPPHHTLRPVSYTHLTLPTKVRV